MIDEQNAFEMIHFMLEAGPEKAIEARFMLLTIFLEPTGMDNRRPFDVGELIGDRQATFVIDRMLLRRIEQLGIDEYAGAAFDGRARRRDHRRAGGRELRG